MGFTAGVCVKCGHPISGHGPDGCSVMEDTGDTGISCEPRYVKCGCKAVNQGYASPAGWHRHKCEKCDLVYEHADLNDASHNVAWPDNPHACPNCGKCDWQRGIYDGPEAPSVQNGLKPEAK